MVTEATGTEIVTNPRVAPGWPRLLRAARAAFDISKVVLAAVGLILLQTGWGALDRLFPESSAVAPALRCFAGRCEGGSTGKCRSDLVGVRPLGRLATDRTGTDTCDSLDLALRAEQGYWLVLACGVCGSLGGGRGGDRWWRHHPDCVAPGIPDAGTWNAGAVRFALRFALPLIATPLFPLLAMGLCALTCAGFGLLYWLPAGIGSVVGGTLLFIPLLLGLLMALLLFGLAAGWPLFHASVAAEAEDLLDALSRSFSYLNQRLGKFVFCVVLAWLIGIPGLLAVDLLATAVTHLAAWGVGLSAPASSLAA